MEQSGLLGIRGEVPGDECEKSGEKSCAGHSTDKMAMTADGINKLGKSSVCACDEQAKRLGGL